MEDNDFKWYDEEDIIDFVKNKERLVYIELGSKDFMAKYEDIPDIIVDFNIKLGSADFYIYDNDKSYGCNPQTIIKTYGMFLNKCDADVRKDIIDRLSKLQQFEEEVKDYKLIDELLYEKVRLELNKQEIER